MREFTLSISNKSLIAIKISLIAVILIGLVVFVANVAPIFANESVTILWTTDSSGTDKTDFEPGDIVYIHGTGFNPTSRIDISVTRPDFVQESCNVDFCNIRFLNGLQTSGAEGEFVYQYDLNGIVGEYNVLASDGTNSAQTTFTDARTINWVTLNGSDSWTPPSPSSNGDPVIVIPGSSITVEISVSTNGSGSANDWKSTRYRIESGSWICVNHGDHTSTGTYTESFTITATASGIYDVSFVAYNDDGCSSGASGTLTLTNAILVESTPICGNGIISGSDVCDDGNTANGDGCSASCQVESGWSCNGQPSVCIADNPTLSSSCGIDIALIIDNSGSISSSELTAMKDAFKDFVDAFLPSTPTQMALVKFNTVGDLVLDYSGDATTIKNAIDSVSSGGSTNWQDGLKEAYDEFDNSPKPDLYVFASDGQPNKYGDTGAYGPGNGFDPNALDAAITMANSIKFSGIRIITLGIGTGGNQDFISNLKAISSDDAYYDTDFNTLAETLAALADDLCGGTISIKKLVNDVPVSGWEFSTSVTGGTSTPPSGTTGNDGFIVFDIEISDTTATVDVTETMQGGYGFVSASCVDQDLNPVGTPGQGTVTGIVIGKNDAIYCEFHNSPAPCSSYSNQQDCEANTCYWCDSCNNPLRNFYYPNGNCVDSSLDCQWDGCEKDCEAQCEGDEDCGDYCSDNTRYFDGMCDLLSTCTCSYSSEDCDDHDCDTPTPFICEGMGTGQIREMGYDYSCSNGVCEKTGTKQCGPTWECPACGECVVKDCGEYSLTCYDTGNVSSWVFGDPPEHETNCVDTFDNDCDNATDCEDPDCVEQMGPQGHLCCLTNSDCESFGEPYYYPEIATCFNNPDVCNQTFDYRPLYPGECGLNNECVPKTPGEITHTCADPYDLDTVPFIGGSVRICSAGCDQDTDCGNKCVGDVWNHNGYCDPIGCQCYYDTYNCNQDDHCYTYDTGCEDRDYYCTANGCEYTYSNRNTDKYDDWVYYCSGDELRKKRQLHDFSCDGTCSDHVSWVDDQSVENCYHYTEYCDGQKRMSDTGFCNNAVPECDSTINEIENCSANNYDECQGTYYWHHYTESCYENSGVTECLPASSTGDCRDQFWCDGQEFCSMEGGMHCQDNSSVDCSMNNIAGISECLYSPDDLCETFDWRDPFTSRCMEDGSNTGHCTTGDNTINHVCADDDNTDGVFNYNSITQTCTAECDGAGIECLPYIDQNDICLYDDACNLMTCLCEYDHDEYCPPAGTIIDGYCYWGTRDCVDVNGCTLNKDPMGCNDYCDPNLGPKDKTGPTTSNLVATKVPELCKININATETDTCSNIAAAEYFLGGATCGTPGTGDTMNVKDGDWDELVEDVIANNVIVSDGSLNIHVRGKDAAGNWGPCMTIAKDIDCIAPDCPTNMNINGETNEVLVCGNNPTLGANICDSQSKIQLAEYFIDTYNPLNWHGILMNAVDGNYDEKCEDVQAIIDISQLSNGTHYVKLHGKDGQENWGKFDYCPVVSFIKDTMPPVASKSVGDPKHTCEQGEGCNYYVTQNTEITLTCYDFNPDDNTNGGYNNLPGEYSKDVTIHWKYRVDNGNWQEFSNKSNQVTFKYPQDSTHELEYWCTDSCNNEGQHQSEIDIVDTQKPNITKIVGDPKVPCDPEDPSNCEYWLRDHVTPIDLYCSDGQPHPVDHVKLWYRILLDGRVLQDWTDPIAEEHKQIIFNEDSIHTLQYYCEDELGNSEGTIQNPHEQIYRVDSTPPETIKTLGTPFWSIDGKEWINSSTTITLTPTDGGQICAVGNDKTWYKNILAGTGQYGDLGEIACSDPENYCEVPQEYKYCQYCPDGKYPKDCIDVYQEDCEDLEVHGHVYSSWGECVQAESNQHCCGGWDWTLYTGPFQKPQESCHILYYFSVDELGNVEDIKVNCFYVENTPPVSSKTLGTPKVECSAEEKAMYGNNDCWYLTDETKVELSCGDVGNHPVNDVNIHYKIEWKENWGDNWQTVKEETVDDYELFYYEDLPNQYWESFHRLTWYCVDALGNAETEHIELDIVDMTPPETVKTVSSPKIAGTNPIEWYITADTNIELNCSDQQPHPVDRVTLYWNVYWSERCVDPSWSLIDSGSSDGYKLITGLSDSCHKIEYHCVDALGNTENTKVEIDAVDNQAPETTEEIIGPEYCTGEGRGMKCFIDGITEINLTCTDQDPHPVGIDNTQYRYRVWNETENGWNDWTDWFVYCESFSFPEESYHELEYYCNDSLGNEEQHHFQYYYVDHTKPVTTKTYGTPRYPDDEHNAEWINSSTPITLTADDGNDAHDSGVRDTFYKDIYLPDTEDWHYCYDDCETFDVNSIKPIDPYQPESWTLYEGPFYKSEESCHIIAYYSVDNVDKVEEIKWQCVFVDNTIPHTEKSVGDPKHACEGQEKCDWYVTQDTEITLECTDLGDHPVDNVKIYYKIDWKELLEDEWTEGQWTEDSNHVTIKYNEDSYHRLSWYCVDALGNSEQERQEIDIVDTQKPTITKRVGDPKIEGTGNVDWWITQDTHIYLDCQDSIPHPVNDVTLYWRDYLDGKTPGQWNVETDGSADIKKNEDCLHVLEWYCVDALGNSEGTAEKPIVEYDQVDTEPPMVEKFVVKDGERIYAPEEGVITIAVKSGDTIKFCANVTDIKQTGDLGVGVETILGRLAGLQDPEFELTWDDIEQAYCYAETMTEECGKWHYEVKAKDLLGNEGEWTDGIEILIDNVPPIGQVLNPHAGNNYYAGKIFSFYAPAVDFGGNDCDCCPLFYEGGECEGYDCPASGVDYCDVYAIDFNFEGLDQSKIKECWEDLWTYFGQVLVDPYIEYIGRVPYENGVCKGYLTIPEDTNLTDTVFMAVEWVDKAGNERFGLALNPWFSPVTMNMEERGYLTLVDYFDSPVTSNDLIRVEATLNESGLSGNKECVGIVEKYDETSMIYITSYQGDITGNVIDGYRCIITGSLPDYSEIDSGDYRFTVEYRLNDDWQVEVIGSDWFDFVVDNTRPTMGVVSPEENESYGELLPVSLHVDDESGIVDQTVKFRLQEIGTFGNLWCLGGCEDTGWIILTKQDNGLYADIINLTKHGIEGNGKYSFDAIACDILYQPDSDPDNKLGIDMQLDRNTVHCKQISLHGASHEVRPECDDGWDNDLDEHIDYPADDGCFSHEDESEEALSVPAGSIIITELMIDPQKVDDDKGEYVELYNTGTKTYDLYGLTLKDNGTNNHVISSSVSVDPGQHVILCRNDNPVENGGFACDYEYGNFALGNVEDEVILMQDGTLIDEVWYDENGWTIPTGSSINLDPYAYDAISNNNPLNWCESMTVFGLGDHGTPGSMNDYCPV